VTKSKAEAFAAKYGSPARARWITEQPCLVCRRLPSENAHTESGGMGMKAGPETIAPVCSEHHRELHQHGIKTFEAKYAHELLGHSLALWAATYDQLWKRLNP
jgi:hypothetical protein